MSPFEQFEESLEAAVPDEETLAHLCSVALEKCQDKAERRRAGCGGAAMRRRVLIKNFVSYLITQQNERSPPLTIVGQDEDFDEELNADEDPKDDEDEEPPNYDSPASPPEHEQYHHHHHHHHHHQPPSELLVASSPSMLYQVYRESAEADVMPIQTMPDQLPPPSYDLPLYDPLCARYDFDAMVLGGSNVEETPLPPLLQTEGLLDQTQQPRAVQAGVSDQLYLEAQDEHRLADLKTFMPNCLAELEPLSIHDLDTNMVTSHYASPISKKRHHCGDEVPSVLLIDPVKRIKL